MAGAKGQGSDKSDGALTVTARGFGYSFAKKLSILLSITSLGAETISLASASRFSPLIGSISRRLFFASANSSGSLKVLAKASRNILTLSGGIPGVAMIGRPKSPEASIRVAKPRIDSGVLYSCISSRTVGTSDNLESRWLPV
jgi:hypothetical protein